MKLSYLLALPLVITAIGVLYLAWERDPGVAWYLIPLVIIILLIYSFSPQIDWWWARRNPPELEPELRRMLNLQAPFYQKLSPEDKERFRHRVAWTELALNFIPQGMESAPADVRFAVAASAAQVSFGMEEFLFGSYENIVLYKHPFPSPQHPEDWHSSEIFDEDGVLMFSAQHLVLGFVNPKQYFPSGLYEYARLFRRIYPDRNYPSPESIQLNTLEKISGFTSDAVQKWIGLPHVDTFGMAGAYYFAYPERFQKFWPEGYEQLRKTFGC
jgi:hypothetical protein